VFAWTYKIAELDEKLPESIVVVGLDLYKPATLAEDIEKCGCILDKEDEASHYLDDFYNKYLDLIKDRTEGLEEPTVYIEGTFGTGGSDCQTFGSKSGAQMMIEMAGGKNLFDDLPDSMPHVELEEVLYRNPDIIIRYCGSDEGGYGVDDTSKMETLRESVIDRMANVTAVQNDSIYIMDKGPTYGPDVPIAVLYWAKWFHPNLFKDLDPKAIHQEWLTEFQGLDCDLDKHGVFVYHPEEHPDGK
jgi:iron complex transport system substrate-binding protein